MRRPHGTSDNLSTEREGLVREHVYGGAGEGGCSFGITFGSDVKIMSWN